MTRRWVLGLLPAAALAALLLFASRQTQDRSSRPLARPPSLPRSEDADPPALQKAATGGPLVLTGQVTDPGGRPLEGTRIYLIDPERAGRHPWTDPAVHRAVASSDAGGRFRLRLQRSSPGSRRLLLHARAGQALLLVETRLPRGNPGATPLATAVLAPAPAFHGEVVDPAGKPLHGAAVRLIPFPRWPGLFDVRNTGSDGRFSFAAAPGGPFRATASSSGLRSVSLELLPSAGAVRFVLGRAATNPPADGLRLTVAVVQGGAPQSGVPVQLVGRTDPSIHRSGRTDANGETIFERLAPGRYVLWYGSAAARSGLKLVQLSAGRPARIVLGDSEETVAGRIFQALSQQPIAGATIQLVDRAAGHAGPVMRSASSDAEGRFRLDRPPGNRPLVLMASLLAPPAGTSWGMILLPEQARQEIELPIDQLVLRVVVTDHDTGQPVTGATVRLLALAKLSRRWGWLTSAARVASARGVLLPHLPRGPARLVVEHPGYASSTRTLKLVEPAGAVTVRLRRGGGALELLAVSSTGKPRRVLVVLRDRSGTPVHSGRTDAGGRILFRSVAAGRYRVEAPGVGAEVTIESGVTARVKLYLPR